MEKDILLSCKGICKNFGPTRALVDVDFELRQGQVCGLIGENGSGKSTLTSIFAGVQVANSGEMFSGSEVYKPANMVQAQRAGVAMVVQEAGTLPGVNVAANVFVGNLERFGKKGFVDTKEMNREANRILSEIGAGELRAEMDISELNFEDRKIVEIARAMYLQPKVLIVDETTTALAGKGRNIIYKLIQKMKEENKAVIFISHDLDELVGVCNTITVLRDGHVAAKLDGTDIAADKMRRHMVGRELMGDYYRSDYDGSSSEEVVLDVQQITSDNGYIRNLSLQLHQGEILGIGGLADSGMHELGRMLFGLDRSITGRVLHTPSGKEIRKPITGIQNRIGYVSKDRDQESIILNASIRENIVIPTLDKIKKGVVVFAGEERKLAAKEVAEMSIKCVSDIQLCSELSGGNKQKVAFAKWLGADCDIFILDCPTRGIDIGVKAAMYKMIYEFKEKGKSVIMISEELMELIGMSDRMLIMKDGGIVAELERSRDITESQIIEYMI